MERRKGNKGGWQDTIGHQFVPKFDVMPNGSIVFENPSMNIVRGEANVRRRDGKNKQKTGGR